MATEESLIAAKQLGFDFICLTGNPKTGVTNDETVAAIKKAREIFGKEGLIVAGKMHVQASQMKRVAALFQKPPFQALLKRALMLF